MSTLATQNQARSHFAEHRPSQVARLVEYFQTHDRITAADAWGMRITAWHSRKPELEALGWKFTKRESRSDSGARVVTHIVIARPGDSPARCLQCGRSLSLTAPESETGLCPDCLLEERATVGGSHEPDAMAAPDRPRGRAGTLFDLRPRPD